ncbi:MAG: dihydrolipoyl dehydrogenase [Candidatus Omnitrophica bacterium]|nr:dihydrolipoyl dehydrogenase [Candidatus Omnitrophota bacterium]MCM8801803.1 dihydrolipoyl dehydrogenase [Candidatus Omnitrophota bacterium]
MGKYDVIVIGGGPAGYPCAIRCSQYGKKVLLIEELALGGVCLNRGCIPTKALYSISEEISNSKYNSIEKKVNYDWNKILNEVLNDVVLRLRTGINMLLKSYKVDLIKGKAIFKDLRTVEVNGNFYTTEYIVIATGSSCYIPECFKNDKRIIISDHLWELQKLPESIAIIGGGFIGCEFASILNKFGVKVKIYEMMDSLLPGKDKEITELLKKSFEKRGIEVNLNIKLESCEMIEAEKIFVSVGRIPNILKLEGLEYDKKGIKTDERLKTNIEKIYAVGDVNGKYQLAYVATKEGEIAAENICGKDEIIDYDSIPEVIFTDPEIGVCGLTEQTAKEKGIEIEIGKFPYSALGRAYADKKTEGFFKVIADKKTEKIIGMHIIGKGATELISFGTLAIKLGIKIKEIEKILYCHPTFAEGIMEAINDLNKKSIHLPPKK